MQLIAQIFFFKFSVSLLYHLNQIQFRYVFEKGELSGLYLNFSDPWPKERHAKRRLTHCWYLEGYRQVIKPGGAIEFKSDNDDLYAFTLEEVAACHMEIVESTDDLHNSQFESRKYRTEYEERFMNRGKNINYIKFLV